MSEKKHSAEESIVKGAVGAAISAAPDGAQGVISAALLGGVAGGAAHMLGLMVDRLRGQDDGRLLAAESRFAARAIEAAAPEISQKIEELSFPPPSGRAIGMKRRMGVRQARRSACSWCSSP